MMNSYCSLHLGEPVCFLFFLSASKEVETPENLQRQRMKDTSSIIGTNTHANSRSPGEIHGSSKESFWQEQGDSWENQI